MTRDDWMRRLGPLYGGAVALVQSTAWRWPRNLGDELGDGLGADTRSASWLVVLGAPIGVVAWIVGEVASALGLPSAICALLALAMLAIASAGIAERGLAERIERGGSTTPGAVTIVVLVLFTLVRAAAIVAIAPAHWLGALVATAVVGRWTAVFLQAVGDPISEDHAPCSLVTAPAPLWVVAALGLGAAVVSGLALGKAGIIALALAAVLAFVLGVDAERRDRGLSAPVVATAAAIGEVVVLLAASAVG